MNQKCIYKFVAKLKYISFRFELELISIKRKIFLLFRLNSTEYGIFTLIVKIHDNLHLFSFSIRVDKYFFTKI